MTALTKIGDLLQKANTQTPPQWATQSFFLLTRSFFLLIPTAKAIPTRMKIARGLAAAALAVALFSIALAPVQGAPKNSACVGREPSVHKCVEECMFLPCIPLTLLFYIFSI